MMDRNKNSSFSVLCNFTLKNGIISFALAIIILSCSNWEDLGVDTKIEKSKYEPVDFWQKLDFPKNTKTFLTYSPTLNLAGTYDGKIYLSTDNCTSWLLAGNIKNNGAVNCFLYCTIADLTQARNYILAGTNNGIYRSSDNGLSWGEVVFDYNLTPTINTLVAQDYRIDAAGTDNKKSPTTPSNYYYSFDYGITWTIDPLRFYTNRVIKTMGYGSSVLYFCIVYSDSLGVTLHTKGQRGEVLFDLSPGVEVNSVNFENLNSILICTNIGVLKSSDQGTTWNKYMLENFDVRFLNGIYAGTDKGLFYSLNQGKNWYDLNPKSTPSSIEYMTTNKQGYLYIKTSEDEYYRMGVSTTSNNSIIRPILYLPIDNSLNVDLNTSLQWIGWGEQNVWYSLQVSTDPKFLKDIVYDLKWYKYTSYQTSNLSQKTKYFWRLKAQDATRATNWSSTWCFTTR